MNTILVYRDSDCWMSETLKDGKPDEQLIKYFGTNLLPTAFTVSEKPHVVVKELERLNPTAQVLIK